MEYNSRMSEENFNLENTENLQETAKEQAERGAGGPGFDAPADAAGEGVGEIAEDHIPSNYAAGDAAGNTSSDTGGGFGDGCDFGDGCGGCDCSFFLHTSLVLIFLGLAGLFALIS
jgi:hypothetical protein